MGKTPVVCSAAKGNSGQVTKSSTDLTRIERRFGDQGSAITRSVADALGFLQDLSVKHFRNKKMKLKPTLLAVLCHDATDGLKMVVRAAAALSVHWQALLGRCFGTFGSFSEFPTEKRHGAKESSHIADLSGVGPFADVSTRIGHLQAL